MPKRYAPNTPRLAARWPRDEHHNGEAEERREIPQPRNQKTKGPDSCPAKGPALEMKKKPPLLRSSGLLLPEAPPPLCQIPRT